MGLIETLEERLGRERVLTTRAALADRRHDYWVLSHLDDLQGRAAPAPLAAIRPRTVEEVAFIVRQCRSAKMELVPFSLGSGVCGGVVAREDRLLLDMSAMNKVRYIDEVNLIAAFDAGKNGLEAENAVAERGLTIGHWPQSIALSSVGGWVATRASGQFSTGYGNIEDIVYALEVVLPDGTIAHLGKAPRAAAGPDLRHVLMGAEGTLGIVTGVTLALRRAAPVRAFSAFHVRALSEGIAVQRAIVQGGWSPVVMRQYDATETRRSFSAEAREDEGLLILVHEGPRALVEAEVAAVRAAAADGGLAEAPASAVAAWMERRNHVPHWKDFLDKGIVLDTIEVSGKWTDIVRIYDDSIRALKAVPDMLNASAHSSHVYRTGLNLYFTFAARPASPSDMAARYAAAWDAVMEATAAAGGGIAHHHGIGRVRKAHLARELGPGGLHLLRSVKKALDPDGLFNPGVLFPDA